MMGQKHSAEEGGGDNVKNQAHTKKHNGDIPECTQGQITTTTAVSGTSYHSCISNDNDISVNNNRAMRPAPRFLGLPPGEEIHCVLSDSLITMIVDNLPVSCLPFFPTSSSSLPPPEWYLLYSSYIHGRSFQKLVQSLVDKGSTLILIKARDSSYIFGGFCGDSWQTVSAREKQDKSRSAAARRASREGQSTHDISRRPANQDKIFFGSQNCFLFTGRDGGKIYHSKPSVNSNFMYLFDTHPLSDRVGIGMGGQNGKFGWFIDRWLENGLCQGIYCSTFSNPRLTDTEEWEIDGVEAYALQPDVVKKLSSAPQEATPSDSCLNRPTTNANKILLELHGVHEFDCRERPEC